MLSTITIPSPVGELTIGASDAGLRFVLWDDDGRNLARAASQGGSAQHRAAVLAETATQLEQYFAGTRTAFDVPLDPVGTAFQQSVWKVLRTIEYGRTVSYAHQARALGDVNKARAVGAANGKNPIGIIVPCHRVVGANGSLTGFAGGVSVKAWLLDHEQRHVRNLADVTGR